MSLRWRLLILIMLAAGIILCAVIIHSTAFARSSLALALRDKAAEMASRAAADIDAKMRMIAKAVDMLAAENAAGLPRFVDEGPEKLGREARRRLTTLLRVNPEIYGAAIALDGGAVGIADGFSPYLCRDGRSVLREVDLANPDYNYSAWDWYTHPRQLGRPLWGDPLYDTGGGNALMVTYSAPFRFVSGRRAADGKPDGVQTGDVTLEWLTAMLGELPLGKGDHAFLVTRQGTVIAHPKDKTAIMKTFAELAETHEDAAEITRWSDEFLSDKPGIVETRNLFSPGASVWAAHQPVSSTGWIMVAILSQGEAERQLGTLALVEAFIGVLGLLFLFVSGLVITGRITRPLRRLTLATKEMARGDFDVPLPAPVGTDEVADLTRHFSAMQGELKRYLENLQIAAASRERIESELRIAAGIQRSFLPAKAPWHPAIDLAAVFMPAKEVGGDLYDMRLDDKANRLFLVIGDVSGKGVPSALFMSMASSLWRSLIAEFDSPTRILSRLNRELAKENAESFFITMFCAVVDLDTGVMRYVNCGHPPQAFRRANGECRWLATKEETPPMLPLGLAEQIEYRECSLQLEPGDMLVLFTDGLSESENAERELLGGGPILETLAKADGDCGATLAEFEALAERHAAGAEQSDDLTLIAFRYLGHEGMPTPDRRGSGITVRRSR